MEVIGKKKIVVCSWCPCIRMENGHWGKYEDEPSDSQWSNCCCHLT